MQTLAIVKDSNIKGNLFVDVAHKLLPPLVEKEPMELILGMESMFDKVWRLLAEDGVRLMGLYGYGGVGKTTLLKHINNEFLNSTTAANHDFDVVILVVVSKVININDIHKEIGDRLGLSSPNKKSIRSALSKKNFLLLLDDVWERVDLQSIGVPSLKNNKYSKIVFTTRSETVCELMKANEMLKVECLPWEEAWSLFQENVGEKALNSHPDVPELAEDVARECGGLPLALITIGQAMSSKKTVQEWNHAKTTLQKSASEFPGMGDEVLPLLKLSYDNLRDYTIKSCFLYCALFPEDVSINKAELIDYWIGEGLILLDEFDHIDEARNYGYYVIGNLKGACLLESGKYEETQVKMHDVIRDLALWIAHECRSKRDKVFIIETSHFMVERSWYNAERIYLNPPPDETEVGSSPPRSPNLITLIYHHHFHYRFGPSKHRKSSVLPQNFFQFMPFLRVLDLSGPDIYTFPISITELHELRYLSLSSTYIKELPEELSKLVKLNYLDLSYMTFLKKIPSGVIGSLLELRVLNLYDSYGDWDLKEVYELKHLNDLGITIHTHHSSLTKLLSSSNKNLQMCTRHLILRNRNPILFDQQSEDVPQSTTSSSSSPIRTLEEKLQFPEAELMNMGIEQQQHLGSCFQNLIQIHISNCNALKDLTWVGYVPNLKTLKVTSCEELEEIVVIVVVNDFGGSTGGGGGGDEIATRTVNSVKDVFKRLQTLIMDGLPKLKSICKNALAFPCLESLEVRRCPELKKLPFDSGSNLNNTLRKITGGPKWWSELQWEEEDNNNNNEPLKSKFLSYLIKFSVYD